MAIKIKSPSDIARKYAEVTPARSAQYEASIGDTNEAEFAQSAVAGEANWKVGVTDAIAKGTFGKNVGKAGAKWKRNALKKGPGNYAVGTAAATEDYAEGFAPYQAVISALTLPPKGPRGAPQNIERVRAIATALRAKKVGQK